jgi:uncharacterized membrane protein
MSEHRYPAATIWADYLRAGGGLALTLGPLLLLDLASPLSLLFGGLAVLFVWFGLRTAVRHASFIELSPDAIAQRGPLERRLRWRELSRVKLAYYGPRRARERGWLQLTLKGGAGHAIRIDSTIDGFERVVSQAQAAAAARELPLDDATSSNLAALGLGAGPGGSSTLTAR